MATNETFRNNSPRVVQATAPASPSSGDPVLYGNQPGVALTDEDADGQTAVAFKGVYKLAVEGADDMGNAAVNAGDILYYDGGDINVDAANGTRFGYAGGGPDDTGELVASGATTTINVVIGY